MRITNSSRGGETTWGANCLTSAGRVTLTGGTTFSHVNTLSHLPETTFCVLCVMKRLVFGLKTTESSKYILKKEISDEQRLQWPHLCEEKLSRVLKTTFPPRQVYQAFSWPC